MSRSSACQFLAVAIVLAASYILVLDAVPQDIRLVHRGGPAHNRSRAGICITEVRTIDLLSPEARRGPIPRGNGSTPEFSKIELCCSGWQRKPHSHYECEPICDNGCQNGNCTAPNVCVCKRGYVKNEIGDCIPTCPVGCLGGVCTVNGACSCNAGFDPSRDGKYCTPRCSGGCGNGGRCVAPETCECQPGFALDPKTRKCGFHCEGGCGAGGVCVAPNQCQCQPGYKKVGHICEPDCPRGCRGGVCTAPNVCTCPAGWTLDANAGLCQAHCSEPCLNADCTGPNVCTCKNGYIKDGYSQTKCVAHCPQGCPNGVCSAPNFCICNPGFVKERKGSNNCIRRLRKRSAMHYDLIPEQIQE